ncbi:hypothetical protein C922_05568 [Plasmodium inui San Antonio 1]|uniref:Uncharacterized protein n=1 Tax=Plasmodium inui San Antonio 1 TaxID=1237626 RepID=W6ZT31_9APIC|nr:hypothetical protein C922_05568 [Plasmodium inui San Antonio 1]EUD64052.1 hypothetical protein C922_05568 [Plasmodium inui San Antonio 1]
MSRRGYISYSECVYILLCSQCYTQILGDIRRRLILSMKCVLEKYENLDLSIRVAGLICIQYGIDPEFHVRDNLPINHSAPEIFIH